MRRLIAATAAGSLAVAAALFGALPASAADTAEVYVVHGIPGLPVDVYVNGALTLDDFQPETVAGPLDLPAGSYAIAITAADAADASAPLLTATADVAGGNSYSIVAHLDADGNPTITPYANDISTISAGQTRLVVRHDAAAPAVDVRAGGTVVLAGVTNPSRGRAEHPGRHRRGRRRARRNRPPWRSARQALTWPKAARRSCTPLAVPPDGTLALVSFVIPGTAFRTRRRSRRHRPRRLRCTDHRPGRAADRRVGGRRQSVDGGSTWTARSDRAVRAPRTNADQVVPPPGCHQPGGGACPDRRRAAGLVGHSTGRRPVRRSARSTPQRQLHWPLRRRRPRGRSRRRTSATAPRRRRRHRRLR